MKKNCLRCVNQVPDDLLHCINSYNFFSPEFNSCNGSDNFCRREKKLHKLRYQTVSLFNHFQLSNAAPRLLFCVSGSFRIENVFDLQFQICGGPRKISFLCSSYQINVFDSFDG